MLNAPAAFQPRAGRRFLRGLLPSVLQLDSAPRTLHLDVGPIASPFEGDRNHVASSVPHAYNPSIAAAPRGICPRCAYVATLRIDQVHQCDAGTSSPAPEASRRGKQPHRFRGTALAVLDADLEVLNWTWYVACPEIQVRASADWASKGWTVQPGAAGAFRAPWAKAVYDARLLNVAGRLVITSSCRGCESGIKWSLLQLTAEVTDAGGVADLRAWASRTFVSRRSASDPKPWAAGRNQALFAVEHADGGIELLAQPWLGVVATFGRLQWQAQSVHCARATTRDLATVSHLLGAPCSVGQGRWWERWENRRRRRDGVQRRAGVEVCGPTPIGTVLSMDALQTVPTRISESDWLGLHGDQLDLTVQANESLPGLRGIGFRLSTTANLVRVRRPGPGEPCEAYLGVGHLHRGDGPQNRRLGYQSGHGAGRSREASRGAEHGAAQPRGQPFLFGYAYTHFFYVLSPRPPWRTLATSGELCLAAEGAPTDCESVQFISSVEVVDPSTLLLAYGVNDCHAKLARLSLERVWQMLQPFEAGGSVCEAAR